MTSLLGLALSTGIGAIGALGVQFAVLWTKAKLDKAESESRAREERAAVLAVLQADMTRVLQQLGEMKATLGKLACRKPGFMICPADEDTSA